MAENEGAAVAVDNAAVPTNEWERMLSGELYICGDMQREANMRKRRLVHAINTSAYDAFEERDRLFRELFGSLGKGAFLEPPFNCDYGCNTYIGDNFYANMDCIFLDVARITIGDRVFFGPRVGLYTPYHPIDAAVRASGPEGARPITIGNDVWFGGSVVVCPGVTIGDDASINGKPALLDLKNGEKVILVLLPLKKHIVCSGTENTHGNQPKHEII